MRSIKLPSWIERLAGLDPVPAPPHVFSLDERRLAYARLPRTGQGSALEEYRSVPLPEGTFQDSLLGGALREVQALEEALAQILDGLEEPVPEASLLLPDAWFRLAFSEIGDLPKDPAQREQVLRWKLKRLVPFRVEELRLQGVEVAPVENQEEPRRVLLAFALETLLARLEAIFSDAGIHLGRVDNLSLATLAAVQGARGPDQVLGVVLADTTGTTLLFARGAEPVLHRFKASEPDLPAEVRERRTLRDLRLTRTFLDERLPSASLSLVLLAQAPEETSPWQRWLEEGLQVPVAPLGEEYLTPLDVRLSRAQAEAADSWLEIAPMLGASRKEVA